MDRVKKRIDIAMSDTGSCCSVKFKNCDLPNVRNVWVSLKYNEFVYGTKIKGPYFLLMFFN